MRAVQRDPQGLMERYRALPEAHGGRYIGADLAKELFSDYSQSPEARNRYNTPVHNSAAVLAALLFDTVIHEATTPDHSSVVFLTGSPGAGKTTSVLERGSIREDVVAVYEGQMFRPEQSFSKLDAALAKGLRPEIFAVHPRPETALENTFNRFETVGRGASTTVMAQIQGELAAGLRAIHSRYGESVGLTIFDTRESPSTKKEGWQHLSILESEGSQHEIKERLDAHLERHRAAGTITDACYRQARSLPPALEKLPTQRMGGRLVEGHERAAHESEAGARTGKAQLLIAQADAKPALLQGELNRAHYLARLDNDWAARYDDKHGPDIAKRSQTLSSRHAARLADELRLATDPKVLHQFPELTVAVSILHATAERLQGMDSDSRHKTLEAFKGKLADRIERGEPLSTPPVRNIEKGLDRER